MSMRIQMSRQKPWRADNPDAVIVARPSKWGNPFQIKREACGEVEDDDRCWVVRREGRRGGMHYATLTEARAGAVDEFRLYLGADLLDMKPAELAGKDLACWCPIDGPCHADVLIELANSK